MLLKRLGLPDVTLLVLYTKDCRLVEGVELDLILMLVQVTFDTHACTSNIIEFLDCRRAVQYGCQLCLHE